ncbi:hypothetical protein NLM33_18865 [Bradyrhizobium sp. CCGUVB1N3]|uniref:hypothetical protein n=1 Tax=Bradyrhizobium sp. CCGUVB1N3 TaxID=2949629 RepID=UPI0020B196D6|nr:hypothetical protein [Bradyrhizobium sp. CCGUVB1N3]MCP3471440.1 hypothetical protein [Bradyrhizobium sp. CCGUVB1N3]MCP3472380.1 hypothetical protein [Bradyrhizobium sp. CCGUVB1N3]
MRFNADEFDSWIESHKLIERPAGGKRSAAWRSYLDQRNQLRVKINRSAVHPRMTEAGCQPYVIDWVGVGYEVNTPERSAMIKSIFSQIASRIVTKKKQLARLYQAKDYESLSEVDRAWMVVETINDLAESFAGQILQAERRLHRFSDRIHAEQINMLERPQAR